MSDYDKIYEVKKEIEATGTMQLVDLNGSKVNFQTDVVVSTDPSKVLLLAIVNQDELDNGEFNFEPTENGKYARRITHNQNIKINHFLCVKTNGEESIKCDIIIHMKEVPPVQKINKPINNVNNVNNVNTQNKSPIRNLENREKDQEEIVRQREKEREREKERDIKKKLSDLSQNKKYQSLKDTDEKYEDDNEDRDEEEERRERQKEMQRQRERERERVIRKRDDDTNPYYKIAIVCLVLFCFIMAFKVIRNGK